MRYKYSITRTYCTKFYVNLVISFVMDDNNTIVKKKRLFIFLVHVINNLLSPSKKLGTKEPS